MAFGNLFLYLNDFNFKSEAVCDADLKGEVLEFSVSLPLFASVRVHGGIRSEFDFMDPLTLAVLGKFDIFVFLSLPSDIRSGTTSIVCIGLVFGSSVPASVISI
jgi:hypothetical protein